MCVNQTTNQILTDETKDEDEYRRKEFTEYQMFREHGYPRQLSLFVNGSALLRVNVSSLREGTFDQTAFIPPRDAITRRQCEHMKPPKPTKTPDPA